MFVRPELETEINESNAEGAFADILSHEAPSRRFEEWYTSDRYYLGVDLAKQHDFSALTIIRANHSIDTLLVVHVQRFAEGMDYIDVGKAIKSIIHGPFLRGKPWVLIVDAGGPGDPIIEDGRRRDNLPCQGVQITSGTRVVNLLDHRGKPSSNHLIPKQFLIKTLYAFVKRKRIEIAEGLDDGPLLAKELKSFDKKVTKSGNIQYEAGQAWFDEKFDDMIMATSLACFWPVYMGLVSAPVHLGKRMVASGSRPWRSR
jgi:hypothetical protein